MLRNSTRSDLNSSDGRRKRQSMFIDSLVVPPRNDLQRVRNNHRNVESLSKDNIQTSHSDSRLRRTVLVVNERNKKEGQLTVPRLGPNSRNAKNSSSSSTTATISNVRSDSNSSISSVDSVFSAIDSNIRDFLYEQLEKTASSSQIGTSCPKKKSFYVIKDDKQDGGAWLEMKEASDPESEASFAFSRTPLEFY
ncbi:hypothetical protein KAFR_0H01330 [Kazachstania africana CBS 2517]|uniref:Uncharacterized protein n=1 Tax=Kazachstania africana (strain ATCC 22294 / BCRC 22015 / CBS 2517 / CECT 1963 / NBRC 1671 / NRRL Y-8276) TaxID=1071382 RepID=H2AYY7_KAZAF|nr:hypothetical protein KAFR_0H01330 [Kazachstania africana CBS 2517]CCF59543.1 hypothetical protein KAFR_0H01330 [Kazachstania africana CBS 2517]